MPHWLLHFLGIDNVSGAAYAWWSGAGSDLGELAIVGALLGLLRKHNCHVTRCPRIGRIRVPGTAWVVCRRHAPGGAPTHDDVIADHLAGTPPVPDAPQAADLSALLAELRGLRTDVTGLAQTVRSLMLADRTALRERQQ